MKTVGTALALITLVALGGAAASNKPFAKAKAPDDLALCTSDGFPRDDELAPCTRIIGDRHSTKPKLAAALTQRCKVRDQKGDRDGALADCNRAIFLMPKFADAYSARASLSDRIGDYDKAIADISLAILYDKKPAFDYFTRAGYFNRRAEFERFFPDEQAQRSKDYDRAIADGSEMLAVTPRAGADSNAVMALRLLQQFAGEQMVVAQMGKDEIAGGVKSDARVWCRGQNPPRKEGPPSEDIILGCTAVIKSTTTTPAEKGEAHFRRAQAAKDEATPEMWFLAGLLGREQPLQAMNNASLIADYREAINLNANVSESHYGIGAASLYEGKYDLALSEFTTAIALNGPDQASSYDGRGDAHFYRGELAEAIADFDESLKLKPDSGGVFLDRCVAHDKKGEFDAALEDCKRAVSLSPDIIGGPRAATASGNVYFHKGDYKSAIASYDQALALVADLKGSVPEALYGRGAAKIRAGDKGAGQTDIDAALKQAPTLAVSEAKNGIGP